ncbi:MAG: nucleotide exchange factor GrpE [Nanoarchaeota archaeon]|nr:nucleotide exchange factor GrpE [Nanoarchaeota archaeon]MBU1031155.1 nucleotide exchange factor GrpE [Nanoarchaeota archaeon]MBU1850411.1 nucleotide exchange factor GrpE [Nanoarchaeota archaeon]
MTGKKESKKSAEKITEKTKEQKIIELTNDLQRVQAEFENYRKRTEQENIKFKECSEAELIKMLLPTLDNFELALKNKTTTKEFSKGIELIYAQLYEILENAGLKKIECTGEKFNPYKHEALLTEESDKEPNIILEELQKGYTFKERILRHTKVKVSK